MALAARAYVARALAEAELGASKSAPERPSRVTLDDVAEVARLAIQHRRREVARGDPLRWRDEDKALVRDSMQEPAVARGG